MSVTATGYNLTYQWQENTGSGWNNISNGGVYSGATTSSLTLTSPTFTMNGYQYHVIVTGGCGAPVTSNAVSIVVRDNAVITVQPVAPAAVCQGTGTQVMSVTATGYNLTYQWQENTGSGWNNISNGGVYSGATSSSLTLTSPTFTMNGYQYHVIVTGGCGGPLASNIVAIVVNAFPLGVSTPATQTVCSDAAITTILLSTGNSMAGTTYSWTRIIILVSQDWQRQAAAISAVHLITSQAPIRQLHILSHQPVQQGVSVIHSRQQL